MAPFTPLLVSRSAGCFSASGPLHVTRSCGILTLRVAICAIDASLKRSQAANERATPDRGETDENRVSAEWFCPKRHRWRAESRAIYTVTSQSTAHRIAYSGCPAMYWNYTVRLPQGGHVQKEETVSEMDSTGTWVPALWCGGCYGNYGKPSGWRVDSRTVVSGRPATSPKPRRQLRDAGDALHFASPALLPTGEEGQGC